MVGSLPRIKITITHGGSDIQLEGYSVITDVFLVENGVSEAIIQATDTRGETFLGRADLNDNIKIEIQYADSGATWKQVFGGWVFDLSPHQSMEQGELITIQARGYGLGLLAMPVGEQYGIESSNSSLNTIKEVLTDATYGIIPKWVQKVLKTATDSGYAFNTTKVADVTSDFRYLYFPYKPALKCLDDMIDLISAANAPNAGVHWIVVPSGTTAYLCLATIGAHENPPADIWPTWWNTNQEKSTIAVAEDMIISDFTKQRSDANYILYHGHFRRPVDADKWTENSAANWINYGLGYVTISNENSLFKVGSYSIKGYSNDTLPGFMCYPTGGAAAWDFTKWGGCFNHPTINYWAYIANAADTTAGCWGPYFFTNITNYYSLNPVFTEGVPPITDNWRSYNIQIGPYSKNVYTATGSPNWNNINFVGWQVTKHSDQASSLYLDGFYFDGWVLRGARDDAKIGTQKARVKVMVDDVAKNDSCISDDDSGVMASLAKAELYRNVTTPIIGEICIPGREEILPGQLAHIHFGRKIDETFNIDINMRFLKVHHRFADKPHGFRSYLTLTDDVKNSRPIQPSTDYNLLLKATNPDYQTRERASQKAREIDITQVILSKNYST